MLRPCARHQSAPGQQPGPYVEIDISDDADAQRHVSQRAGISDWPVIELDGKFAAGSNIVALFRTLALELSARPGPPTGCC
jgi:hypothetical protein